MLGRFSEVLQNAADAVSIHNILSIKLFNQINSNEICILIQVQDK